jgi:hypothetical protein
MSLLNYRCPNTSNEVLPGIDTDAIRVGTNE